MKTRKCKIVLVALTGFCLPFLGCNKSPDSQSKSTKASQQQAGKPGGPVALRLKWPVGTRVMQRMDMTQASETLIPGAPSPMKQDITVGQEFALSVLKEREGGGRELELEFLGNQVMMTMGEQTLVNFNSHGEATDDGKNPMTAIFRKMVGARILYLLDASNRVEKVESLDDFRKRLTTGAPATTTAILNTIFTEDYFKQMVDLGKSLPPNPVQPGDTWPVQMEVTMGPLGTMVMDLQYTFKAWEQHEKRNCALLEYTGTLKTKAGRNAGPMGMNFVIEDGKSTGKSWFDPVAGMFLESVINQNLRMNMTMPALAGGRTNAGPQTQTYTNLMSQKITIKVLENSGTSK